MSPQGVWAQSGQRWAGSQSVSLQRGLPPTPTLHHSHWLGSLALMVRSLWERKETAAMVFRFLSQSLFWQNEPVWAEALGEKPTRWFYLIGSDKPLLGRFTIEILHLPHQRFTVSPGMWDQKQPSMSCLGPGLGGTVTCR